MTLSNVETMDSVREKRTMYLSPVRNDDCKTSGECSRSRCLQVSFNLNIVEEKEENDSKPSSKLLGPANESLLSEYDYAKVSSDSKITNCAQKRRSVNKKEELFCFRRTLKMLGFEAKDFGICEEDKKLQVRNTSSPRSGPVLSTRVKERTVSLENLRSALQDIASGAPSGDMSREMLARAAYEEWYFQKLHKQNNMKKMQTERQKQLQQTKEKVNLEQKKKTEESFKKWLAQKNKQLHNNKNKQQKPSDSTADKPRESEQNDAFIYWKKQKDKILRQKKLTQQQNEVKNKPRETDKETEKRFQMWKNKTDKALKAKVLQEKIKESEMQEKKKREEEERKSSAHAAFLAWKKSKDEQLKRESAQRKLLAERKQRERVEKEAERSYESEQAFEEWLDDIEERQNKHTRLSTIVKEPWSPGGSTNWLHTF